MREEIKTYLRGGVLMDSKVIKKTENEEEMKK